MNAPPHATSRVADGEASREEFGTESGPWLFSPRIDLSMFAGSAALALSFLSLGAALGVVHDDTPSWGFLLFVVGVDVAHVWSTLFRVYLDGDERARRPLLYYGLPAACYVFGLLLFGLSTRLFWSALAYFAVYHFVRQQMGFLALYRRGAPLSIFERRLEQSALLLSMVYPLAHWHCQLPQAMWWMIENDFLAGTPLVVAQALGLGYAVVGSLYCVQQVRRFATGQIQWGPLCLVLSTATCWYVGIVAVPSDYAFTVTNVLLHGVPYAMLTYQVGRRSAELKPTGGLRPLRSGARGVSYFLCVIWSLALLEELLWHTLVFHDQQALFGQVAWLERWSHPYWIPALAVPQLTHYVLDGIVWKRRNRAAVM